MMERGKIYTREQIQTVWSQHHCDCESVVWSDDEGKTWNVPCSIDSGKWPLFSEKNGHCIPWVFAINPKRVKLEIKRGFTILDGHKRIPTSAVFGKLQGNPIYFSFAIPNNFVGVDTVVFENRGGRKLILVGVDNNQIILPTAHGIKSNKGVLKETDIYDCTRY